MNVLVYSNFHRNGQDEGFIYASSRRHNYTPVGPPEALRSNPYVKKKHIDFVNLMRRIASAFILAIKSFRYDVLAVDSALTGALVSCFLPFGIGPRLVVLSFNVPRRRTGWAKTVSRILFSRINHFIVHSRYDIGLLEELYGIDPSRVTYAPYSRGEVYQGEWPKEVDAELPERFVFSFGGNARDYGTLFEAARSVEVPVIVAARDYNIAGLVPPDNMIVFTNIPLIACDYLVRTCEYTVFTFDGSEPSCGQMSVVASFRAGKPVVCSDWQAMHDYVTEEKNGLFVEMNNAEDLAEKMNRLLNDQSLYERLSRGASDWCVDEIGEEAVVSRLDNIVDSFSKGVSERSAELSSESNVAP